MKYIVVLFLVIATLISCKEKASSVDRRDTTKDRDSMNLQPLPPTPAKVTTWKGTIDHKIPVVIHYQTDSNLMMGEITYLSTKQQEPIKLIGLIQDDNNYRFQEFEKTGNISGVINVNSTSGKLTGTWMSPVTMKELPVELFAVDTNLVATAEIKADRNTAFGKYAYEYGKKGYKGYFTLNKIDEMKAEFEISAVTSEDRGLNLADVKKDTINLPTNNFTYEIPHSGKCGFGVKLYKDFAYIYYTNGYCTGQFGHNATIEGIFLKVK
ncbi:hypothetical protein [Gynurincola endophyticus]|uniref:hypothetical protein n=1 Tax=Gynurincola endophyticus TaxID=2479004 RepID=UPI000F8EAD6C|nr:hypothetical protein [Gynurincola endophyticus]